MARRKRDPDAFGGKQRPPTTMRKSEIPIQIIGHDATTGRGGIPSGTVAIAGRTVLCVELIDGTTAEQASNEALTVLVSALRELCDGWLERQDELEDED